MSGSNNMTTKHSKDKTRCARIFSLAICIIACNTSIFAHHRSSGKFSHSFDRFRPRGIYSCCDFCAFFVAAVEALGLHVHACIRKNRVRDTILLGNNLSPSPSRAPLSLPFFHSDDHSDRQIYYFSGSHVHSGHLGELAVEEAEVVVVEEELAQRRLELVEVEVRLSQQAWEF